MRRPWKGRGGARWLLAGALVATLLSAAPVDAARGDGPPIGVLLHNDPEPLLVVPDGGGQLLVELRDGRRQTLAPGPALLTFEGTRASLGPVRVDGQPFGFGVAGGGLLALEEDQYAGAGERTPRYEGWIEVVPRRSNAARWRVVNRLRLERYLLGVVGREMPASFHPEALEAQAIASRTYAVYQVLRRPPDAPFHVTDNTRSQVFGGAGAADPVRRAVARTRGQVLLFDGKVFEAFFHSTCGGATFDGHEAFGAPAIEPFESSPCGYCRASRLYRWGETRIPERSIRAALANLCREHGVKLETIAAIEPLERGPGGHAAYVRIQHAAGSFELDAIAFRLQLIGRHPELRSTSFDCQADGDDFVFSGRGWGHGVGMCQFGVNGLAEQGYDAIGILQHYYHGSQVFELWR